MLLRPLLLLGFSLSLIACGGDPATPDPAASGAASDAPTAEAVAATEIAWEDLMPDGEDAVLEALYAEFYREFEERMMAQQQPLSSAADQADDSILSSITEGSDLDTMQQIGTFNVVEDMDGRSVRMPGYIVPLDFSAESKHTEFLLVPYFGACLHSPPPPPNQIVYVTADPAAEIPDIYEPVWIEGTMSTGRFNTDMGNSAYEIALARLDPYEY